MTMAHENLGRDQHSEGSSDRSFGLVFAGVFSVIAAFPLLYKAQPRWWALAIAVAFGLVAMLLPTLLSGFNRLWTRFGLVLGKVVSPIALGIVFFGVLTPVAALMRVRGKDPLRLKRDRVAESYWVLRTPPGPPPESMTHQF
jgi:predicted membrane metal-binding protein